MSRAIFGPVLSRRLGISLGIDPVPYKTCSFDCIYCQLGRTTRKTVERMEYISHKKILGELNRFLEEKRDRIDHITFSGSGEPTLNSETGRMLKEIKRMTDIPIAVLTNGSLLFREDMRQELRHADLVLPSLDAGTQRTFERINRPHESLTLEIIVEGVKKFAKDFDGEIWLEIMLVRGVNDDPKEVEMMKSMIEEIGPDRVQLNTVVRPPCEQVEQLDIHEMEKIRKFLGVKAEVIPASPPAGVESGSGMNMMMDLLRRRPCTTDEISRATGLHRNEVMKYINMLRAEHRIKEKRHDDRIYFVMTE